MKAKSNLGRRSKQMKSGGKKLAAWVRSQTKKNPRHSSRRVRKSTGWLSAKAVRVVKRGGAYTVEVKRPDHVNPHRSRSEWYEVHLYGKAEGPTFYSKRKASQFAAQLARETGEKLRGRDRAIKVLHMRPR